MNTSINARETKRAIVNGGPTHCAQTQMPTWQQQHYRFSYPTLIAHPSSRNAIVSVSVSVSLSAHFFPLLLPAAVVAPATRLGGGGAAVVAVLLANVHQHLFQIVPERIRGGLVVLRQLPPNLILHAETLHSFLKHPIELPHALNLLVFLLEFVRHGLLYRLHQHSWLPHSLLFKLQPHSLCLKNGKESHERNVFIQLLSRDSKKREKQRELTCCAMKRSISDCWFWKWKTRSWSKEEGLILCDAGGTLDSVMQSLERFLGRGML